MADDRVRPQVATAPVNWNNDDVPELRPKVPYRQMLREMREAGYGATEFGSGMPMRVDELSEALRQERLSMVGSFCAVPLDSEEFADRHLPRVESTASFLKSLGGEVLLLSDAIRRERSAWAGRTEAPGAPRWSGEERRLALDNIHTVCRRVTDLGLRVAFHPHAATYVEGPTEVRWLLDQSDPGLLDLCLDTGHITYGGGDAADVARQYAQRVRVVHLKDVDERKLERARQEGWTFEMALRTYLFPRLGQGVVDFPAIMASLRAAGFDGWAVVEQDTQEGEPLMAAAANRSYLRDTFAL